MRNRSDLGHIPRSPALYALIGGYGQRKYVAYVGIAKKLRSRITQHLILRDSSVTTGTSAVSLNPAYITEVRWWESDNFMERNKLEAAELVALSVLNPALRSRGSPTDSAQKLSEQTRFRKTIELLLAGPPAGVFEIPTLQATLHRIEELEMRILKLEVESRHPVPGRQRTRRS